ncbi:MAG: hypothetical protein ABI051_00890 [Vicinamibacterales bacterium]
MRLDRSIAIRTAGGLLVLLLTAVPAAAQVGLAQAKDLYASASYEEALQALGTLPVRTTSIESTEVATYQVFCLLALGRSAEAKQAIEAIVHSDPLFHPTDGQASPRLRAFFEDTRRPFLPDIVRQTYAHGKEAFTRKNAADALVDFNRVIALVDELGETADPGIADLRTLASGFRDLAATIVAPAPPPVAAAPAPVVAAPAAVSAAATGAPASPASSASATPADAGGTPTPRLYSVTDADVMKPIAISRAFPEWRPFNPTEARRDFNGTLDVVTNEMGMVVSATIVKSIHPLYDPMLLRAAAAWRFKPATKNGMPVRYTSRIDIRLTPK